MTFRSWLKTRLPDRRALQLRLGLCEQSVLRSQGKSCVAGIANTHEGHWDISGADNRPVTEPNWWQRTLMNPAIWHLNRRSAAGGAAVGLFVSWLPLPLQMVVAAVLAVILRVHVPVAVVMVWFTNPLTVVPQQAGFAAWPTLLTGCVFLAMVSAVLGYYAMLGCWRLSARVRWRQRQLKRQK